MNIGPIREIGDRKVAIPKLNPARTVPPTPTPAPVHREKVPT